MDSGNAIFAFIVLRPVLVKHWDAGIPSVRPLAETDWVSGVRYRPSCLAEISGGSGNLLVPAMPRPYLKNRASELKSVICRNISSQCFYSSLIFLPPYFGIVFRFVLAMLAFRCIASMVGALYCLDVFAGMQAAALRIRLLARSGPDVGVALYCQDSRKHDSLFQDGSGLLATSAEKSWHAELVIGGCCVAGAVLWRVPNDSAHSALTG